MFPIREWLVYLMANQRKDCGTDIPSPRERPCKIERLVQLLSYKKEECTYSVVLEETGLFGNLLANQCEGCERGWGSPNFNKGTNTVVL